MKLDILWICISIFLMATMIQAQVFTRMNKPVVDLNAKPQVTTPRRPEDRRKLSIFPKSMMKFVVTTKPYSKVQSYSPWEVTTKRPFVQKLLPSVAKTSKIVPITLPTVTRLTYRPTEQTTSREVYNERETAYISNQEEGNMDMSEEVYDYPENEQDSNLRISKINNQSVTQDFEPESEGTDEILVASSSEKTNQNVSTSQVANVTKVTSTESNDITSAKNLVLELETSRQKRLSSILSFSDFNNVNVIKKIFREEQKNKDNIYGDEEKQDNNEFIFIDEKIRPVYKKEESHDIILDEDQEIATESIWLEESDNLRAERSVNIIEEENLGTTISGFKFTGQEPRVTSHLVFKNINA